jgi:hypothetical protein
MEFLLLARKTEADYRCPHSVRFFNLSDGTHSSERAACLGRQASECVLYGSLHRFETDDHLSDLAIAEYL